MSAIRFRLGSFGRKWRQVGRILGGDWDLNYEAFGSKQPLIGFRERFLLHREWEETSLHSEFHDRLTRKGEGRGGVRNWADYKTQHLLRWEQTYGDMNQHGYRSQASLGGKAIDEVEVAISRSAEILIVDGQHRLAMAILLKIESIPVIIDAVHAEFVKYLKPKNSRLTPADVVLAIADQAARV